MKKSEYINRLEEVYGWPMSESDHEKIIELAIETKSGSLILQQLRVWSHEVNKKPVKIEKFLQWREKEKAPEGRSPFRNLPWNIEKKEVEIPIN